MNLFGVELWERSPLRRCSRPRLLPVLRGHPGRAGAAETTATGIVGAYGGLVYLSTVLGGWHRRPVARHGAHRVLRRRRRDVGSRRPCDPAWADGRRRRSHAGGIGLGALKANASSLLGTLYDKGDARADGGFTLFYLGINLGAFVGPLITGLLQTRVGFHYGFGAAGSRDGTGARPVRGLPTKSRYARPRRTESVTAQCRLSCMSVLQPSSLR